MRCGRVLTGVWSWNLLFEDWISLLGQSCVYSSVALGLCSTFFAHLKLRCELVQSGWRKMCCFQTWQREHLRKRPSDGTPLLGLRLLVNLCSYSFNLCGFEQLYMSISCIHYTTSIHEFFGFVLLFLLQKNVSSCVCVCVCDGQAYPCYSHVKMGRVSSYLPTC